MASNIEKRICEKCNNKLASWQTRFCSRNCYLHGTNKRRMTRKERTELESVAFLDRLNKRLILEGRKPILCHKQSS